MFHVSTQPIGESVTVATEDGPRTLQVAESTGPFHDLMALPAPVLQALNAGHLRELARAPTIYVARLQEEDGEPIPATLDFGNGVAVQVLVLERQGDRALVQLLPTAASDEPSDGPSEESRL